MRLKHRCRSRHRDILGDVAEALIYTLPDTTPEGKVVRLGDTYCEVKAEALVVTLAQRLPEEKAEN